MSDLRKSRYVMPMLVGVLTAAIGLVFGGLTVASADRNQSGGHPGRPTSSAPARHGDSIPNVTLVENQIKAYYGSVPGGTATVNGASVKLTYPDPNGNYAAEVEHIVGKAEHYLAHRIQREHGKRSPAVVFDVDDTTLNTYDYEIYSSFAYNPATNGQFVDQGLFPAVFAMPQLVNWAGSHGYTVFFITGRPDTQRKGTVDNLAKVGYSVPTDSTHLFLKSSPLPSYVTCTGVDGACTTIDYKSGTRAHIESLGYHIVADFGDQFSDLKGGHAGHEVKLPNPMYYLP
jgi:predicted secreted acid phosphatase